MHHDANFEWSSLEIDPRLIAVIRDEFKFTYMTPVQKAVVPLFINYKDICCEAVTGSGKTLSFIISMLQIILRNFDKSEYSKNQLVGLVISPTRELSSQTYHVLTQFIRSPALNFLTSQLYIGGAPKSIDLKKFNERGCNIVVATPGRLLELFQTYTEFVRAVKHLEVLVIDETDKILDIGLEKQLKNILTYLPKQIRVGLFSATQTNSIAKLMKLGLRNPVHIRVKEKISEKVVPGGSSSTIVDPSLNETGLNIAQRLANKYTVVQSHGHKLPLLINFININPEAKYMAFFATCAQIDHFQNLIESFIPKTITLFTIHRKEKHRRKIYNLFRTCTSGALLLCTDIMSRGIDIPGIDYVINIDLPNTIQEYIHRAGRSGHTLNEKGHSLVIVTENELEFIKICQDKNIIFKRLNNNPELLEKRKVKMEDQLRSTVRSTVEKFELSMRAFVSFVRTYLSKNLIGRHMAEQVDIADLANSFGLIRIPYMPEIRRKIRDFQTQLRITSEDKDLVKSYAMELKEKKQSKKGEEEEDDDDDDGKFNARKTILSKKKKKKMKRADWEQYDLEQLNADAKIVKKLKRREITEAEFDKHFGF